MMSNFSSIILFFHLINLLHPWIAVIIIFINEKRLNWILRKNEHWMGKWNGANVKRVYNNDSISFKLNDCKLFNKMYGTKLNDKRQFYEWFQLFQFKVNLI